MRVRSFFSFFFFNDTATTEIYTLSLHDALPICLPCGPNWWIEKAFTGCAPTRWLGLWDTGAHSCVALSYIRLLVLPDVSRRGFVILYKIGRASCRERV